RNTVALAKAIRQALPEIRRDLPGSVELETIFDRSVPIVASVDDVKQTLLIAFIMVVAVIFLFMGRLTDTIIPAISLPASLLLTFVVMYLLGYNLDLLSLMALTMAVGFLVDDAIVVLENTARHVEAGQKPYQAALVGSREITGTVLSMTMSLAVVFLPLVFMPGVIGRVFRAFAVTSVVAILCSGLISITLTPSMCGRFLRARQKGDLGLLERTSGAIVGFFQKIYLFFLRGILRFSLIAIVIWIGCLYGTFWMFKHVPVTFLPPGDSGAILGDMKGQHGTSPELMRQYQEEVEAVLAENPNVQMVFTVSGMSQLGGNKGFVFITLSPRAQRPPIGRVVQNLGRRLLAIPGVKTSLSPLPVLNLGVNGGGDGGGEYSFVLRGSDPETLYKTADEFTQKLSQLSGFRDVASSLDLNAPQLNIKIKTERAASLGVEAKEIERTLLLAFAGYQISTIKAATEEYQVIVEVAAEDRRRPEDLDKLYVRSSGGGKLVPLSEVAEWVESVGPMEVKHLDQQNEVSVEFNLDEGIHLGQATKTVEALAAETIPPTINAGFKGEAEEFKKMTKSLFFLMIIALLVMYLVLGVLYESYIHPITVLSALPVAGFGGLLTLYVFHSELSIYAFVGLFLLMGIVKKNGIMMVDFANQRLAEGVESRREAIYQACQTRFRPIVMTGLAAIMGAMPIALGWGVDGSSRQPLGLTVVGGLIFSQLITLFITPVIYLYLEWFQEKVLFRLAFFRPPEGRRARLAQD
ncbi:MAG: efflux RND transporter permease subunit, partial [Deltaproteobacteria bacterium]|nr:efflux RND transporter permease subunit [Deltaproteobacteria bacterium]